MPDERALRVAMAVCAAVAAVSSALGIGVRSSYGAHVTGDEPHYLLTATSLGEDLSLDVADEYAAARYRPYHELRLDPQAARGPNGRLTEPHDPLLPALLALPMRAGGWVGAKLALSAAAAALAALLVWTAVRRFEVPVRIAGVVVGLFAASAPLAVYGQQVYPEIVAAAVVALGIAALTGPLGRGGLGVLGVAVVALPWLSVKYAPVAAVLAGLGVVRVPRRRAAVFAVTLAAAAAVFVVCHLAWYGGLTPYAAGEHFVERGELSVAGRSFDPIGRATRLVGLLVDARFGLAVWQPGWLLLVPAAAALVRRRPAGWDVLLLPVATGWAVATFVAVTMHGWWFPGRQVVVVAPAAVLAIAWWVGRSRVRFATAAVLATAGAGIYGWTLALGLQGRLTWAVDPFTLPVWRAPFPDHMDPTAATSVVHAAWTAVLVVALVWSWVREGEGGRRGGPPQTVSVPINASTSR